MIYDSAIACAKAFVLTLALLLPSCGVGRAGRSKMPVATDVKPLREMSWSDPDDGPGWVLCRGVAPTGFYRVWRQDTPDKNGLRLKLVFRTWGEGSLVKGGPYRIPSAYPFTLVSRNLYTGTVELAGGNSAFALMDLATGKPVRILKLEYGSVDEVSISSNGRFIGVLSHVGGSLDRRTAVTLIDTATWKLNHVADLGNGNGSPWRVVVSNDGKYIAIVGWNHGAIMVDTVVRKPLWSKRVGPEITYTCGVFSPDSKSFYAAGWRGRVYHHDLKTGDVPNVWIAGAGRSGNGQKINDMTISPDGRWLAGATGTDDLYLWDTGSGKKRMVRRRSNRASLASFSPDSRLMATVSDTKITVWQLPKEEKGKPEDRPAPLTEQLVDTLAESIYISPDSEAGRRKRLEAERKARAEALAKAKRDKAQEKRRRFLAEYAKYKKTASSKVATKEVKAEAWRSLCQNWGLPGQTVAGSRLVYSDGKASVQDDLTLDLGRGVSMKLVKIPAGTFMLGSPAREYKRGEDEGPQHSVTLTRPFYMGIYEVTYGQFSAFVADTSYKTTAEKEGWAFALKGKKIVKVKGASWRRPGFRQSDSHPVVCMSWYDAKAFCKWLSHKIGQDVRLPTEAEWEYACRAGTITPFHTGKSITTDQANYYGGYTYWGGAKGVIRGKPLAVGTFKPNAFGLYDMHGNVWEWCSDWYKDSYVSAKAAGANVTAHDPKGPSSGSKRVVRSGSWGAPPSYCRSAVRIGEIPSLRDISAGFRVVVYK